MTKFSLFSLLWSLALGLSTGTGAEAVAAPGAKDFVASSKSFMTEMVSAAHYSKTNDGSVSAASQMLVKSISSKIDFGQLAGRSFGKRWSTFAASDRKAFLITLQDLLEVVVYPQARKIAINSDDMNYQSVAGQPGHVRVSADIEREKKGERVTQKINIVLVHDLKSGRVIDAIIEDEQVSANFKRQFDEALKKQTFKKIIEQMRKRVADARAGKKTG